MSEFEVEVRWLSERGEGVAQVQNKPARFADALPGERLRVTQKKGVKGVAATRLTTSPDRVDPGCEVFGACGGCTVRHASPSLQHAAREMLLRRALREVAREEAFRFVTAPRSDGWRGRARLQWTTVGSRVSLGFFASGTHDVVDLPRCPVLIAPLEAALEGLRAALGGIARSGELALAMGRGGPVALIAPAQQPDVAGYRVVESLVGTTLVGAALRVPGTDRPTSYGDPRPVVMGGDGAPLVTGIDGFAQSNEAVSVRVAEEIVAQAEAAGREVFEFHAGAGNFTVALAKNAKRVTALESDLDAVIALRENLGRRAIENVVVRHGADDEVKGPIKAEVVVLDPPRVGARAVAEMLARHPVKRVVYVSCDPATLARDLGLLAPAYEVRSVTGFEMFPQTLHIESVVRLERRAGAVLRSRW